MADASGDTAGTNTKMAVLKTAPRVPFADVSAPSLPGGDSDSALSRYYTETYQHMATPVAATQGALLELSALRPACNSSRIARGLGGGIACPWPIGFAARNIDTAGMAFRLAASRKRSGRV